MGATAAETPSLPQAQHSAIAKPGKLLTNPYGRKLPGFPCLNLPKDFESALRLLFHQSTASPPPASSTSGCWKPRDVRSSVSWLWNVDRRKTSGALTPKKKGRSLSAQLSLVFNGKLHYGSAVATKNLPQEKSSARRPTARVLGLLILISILMHFELWSIQPSCI